MDDRAALIRSIGESWDDPTPVLVYADYAEERGLDDPALLRWYGREVMPVIAGVRCEVRTAPPEGFERVREALRKSIRAVHPQAAMLMRLAAVAFCRRPCVWEQLDDERSRRAVVAARLFALGLMTDAERKQIAREATRRASTFDWRPSAGLWAQGSALHAAANAADDAGPAVARHALRAAEQRIGGREAALVEANWQLALLDALGRVPPLYAAGRAG